jgi:hypothetical protein
MASGREAIGDRGQNSVSNRIPALQRTHHAAEQPSFFVPPLWPRYNGRDMEENPYKAPVEFDWSPPVDSISPPRERVSRHELLLRGLGVVACMLGLHLVQANRLWSVIAGVAGLLSVFLLARVRSKPPA